MKTTNDPFVDVDVTESGNIRSGFSMRVSLVDFVFSQGLAKGEGAQHEIQEHESSQGTIETDRDIKRVDGLLELGDCVGVGGVVAVI